jgi:hypothetical protein
VRCTAGTVGGADTAAFAGNGIHIYIEPCRTQPRVIFHVSPDGSARCIRDDGYIARPKDPWRVSSQVKGAEWSLILAIPFRWLGRTGAVRRKPIRVNVVRTLPLPGKPGTGSCSWADATPAKGRLVWGFLNPDKNFGWLQFGV